jgi:hypothetical protein
MITEIALRRHKILIHWEKHGLLSTVDAFGVLKRTLYNWKRTLKEGGGKIEALNPKSRRPKTTRKRSWDYRILEEMKRLRGADVHPNLGLEKLQPLLADFCDVLGIKCPSSTTVERLIKDLGGLRTYPQKITGTGRILYQNHLRHCHQVTFLANFCSFLFLDHANVSA